MKKIKLKQNVKPYLYLLPAFLGITVFVIYPMIRSVYMSFFTDYNIFKHQGSGFGLKSYIKVINDGKFILGVTNTLKYTLVTVPVAVAISLFIAVLLNTRIRGWKVFQSIYFIPYVTNLIAIGLSFKFLFHSNYGLINLVMSKFGAEPIQWLNNVNYSLPALMIFGVWAGLAFKIVVFLAGLQNIDKQLIEAAQVDGARPVQIFFKVTLPLLLPVLAYIIIISVIGSLKTYVEVVSLFQGAGPANSAMTIVYYVYDEFYNANNPVIASAASVLLFVGILIITLIQQKLLHRDV
jgi:multiple sugar transport system permease protein